MFYKDKQEREQIDILAISLSDQNVLCLYILQLRSQYNKEDTTMERNASL